MFGSSLTIGNDILDIGSQKFDRQADERAIGSGAMIPRLALGEPGQFEVPNVADVSLYFFHLGVILHYINELNMIYITMLYFFMLSINCNIFYPLINCC